MIMIILPSISLELYPLGRQMVHQDANCGAEQQTIELGTRHDTHEKHT